MTKRRNFPARIRKAAYERAGGRCEECGCDLTGKRWDCDHIIPDWLGGEPVLENARVLCAGSRDTCHGRKSAERDIPQIAKAKRQARKLGVDRETNPVKRRGPKLQSRPFPKSHRPMRRAAP